jgi:hypothetical protein
MLYLIINLNLIKKAVACSRSNFSHVKRFKKIEKLVIIGHEKNRTI